MNKGNKTSRRKGRSNRDPERAARRRRFAAAFLVAVAGLGAFVAASAGLNALDRRAARHLVPGDPLVTVAWPRDGHGEVWLPVDERERLSALMESAASGGRGLSRGPLAEVGRALDSTGWFEGAPTVRWTPDATIEASGRWRAPAAAVRAGSREHLVDFEGRLLPLDYPAGGSNQVFLLNPSQPIVRPGEAWGGADLRAGLGLVRLLQHEGLLAQVAGIDLGEGRENGRLSIITDRGTRVVWGGGPEHLRPGEQPTSVKVRRLHTLLERTGRIDGDADRIDLRGPQILLERSVG